MFFCDFCKMFKNTFLTPPGDYFWFFRSLPKDIGILYYKHQNETNWGDNVAFNANIENIFVCCDNFESRHHE